MRFVTSLFLIIAILPSDLKAQPKTSKPMTKVEMQAAEKAAIAKYDSLPEECRSAAVSHWKQLLDDARKEAKGKPKPKNLRESKRVPDSGFNDPVIYPMIWTPDAENGNLEITKGHIGDNKLRWGRRPLKASTFFR